MRRRKKHQKKMPARVKPKFGVSPIGLPPGSMVHPGNKPDEKVYLTAYMYNDEHYEKKELDRLSDLGTIRENMVTWLNIDGLHDMDLMKEIADTYDIHSLLIEDILNTSQRPKVDVIGNKVFIVIKMISVDQAGSIEYEQVSILFWDDMVITFQENRGDVFDPIRQRIFRQFGTVRRLGADYLAYSLMDMIVDQYYATLEKLGEQIELLEENIPDRTEAGFIRKIHELRQEVLLIRKAAWPLREVINHLGKDEPLINAAVKPYIRDLSDHIITIIDNVETYRDITNGLMDIYLSNVSIKTNEIMKVLTVISTIFIPLTFITGVYGMNFTFMPELDRQWAYPAVWGVMILIVLGQLMYFKRKKWM